jgi:hypothetical protein
MIGFFRQLIGLFIVTTRKIVFPDGPKQFLQVGEGLPVYYRSPAKIISANEKIHHPYPRAPPPASPSG